MENTWQFHIRINVTAELAAALRGDPEATAHPPLCDILRRHDAFLKSQYDAFADYVSEAERLGPAQYPLYQWTKATIENPGKKTKYLQIFTVYADGQEVYSGEVADTLQSELSALGPDAGITSVVKLDTNPANNPQPPRQAR